MNVRAYVLKEDAKTEPKAKAGAIVYDFIGDNFGTRRDDTRTFGVEYVSVTLRPDGGGFFFNVPRSTLDGMPQFDLSQITGPHIHLLVCGGRRFADIALVRRTLDEIHRHFCIELLISGGAGKRMRRLTDPNNIKSEPDWVVEYGADLLAEEWAKYHRVPYWIFRVKDNDWAEHGGAAGPMRNARMLAEGKPNYCLAFPGGAGTTDMITKCEKSGVPVLKMKP